MTDKNNAAMHFKGRVWMVGDNINTDLILPNKAFYLTHEEQTQYVFSANRPGWAQQVQKGDILIGGHNFGTDDAVRRKPAPILPIEPDTAA